MLVRCIFRGCEDSAATGVPHEEQNLAFGATSAPQDLHVEVCLAVGACCSSWLQFGQLVEESLIGYPHLGHVLGATPGVESANIIPSDTVLLILSATGVVGLWAEEASFKLLLHFSHFVSPSEFSHPQFLHLIFVSFTRLVVS